MTEPLVMEGKALAKSIEKSLAERVERIKRENDGRAPALAAVIVGEDPASVTYVRMKCNACERVGMLSKKIELPDSTTNAQLLEAIQALNDDPDVHGIILQHPVPEQIDERAAFEQIALEKDVDGLTCIGFGRMAMGEAAFGSATPRGIMRMLDHYKIELEGKRAVVVGRSPILGKPMAMMMLNRHATVTICHSRTQDLPGVVREADVVVGAVGKAEFIRGDWIKPGAVVIDAGYNAGNVGDVDLKGAIPRCSAYTPVPGGVGPMTINTLITQTVESGERVFGIGPD